MLCICARLFICALWSPAGKGLTSWLSFVVSNCEFVTFSLVSWVRSRYLDDILNINNVYFDNIVSQIYPSELQLNKVNTSDTEAAFLTCICLFLMIWFLSKFMINGSTLISKLSIFPFIDGDVPRSTSYEVYISQLIHFATASSCVTDFNTRYKL